MITLEAIRVVDAIARHGSFSAASLALDRVPSALTYTVRRLEADLGVPLFERQGRGMRLTPAGEALLHQGRELLASAGQLAEQVRRTAGGWETELRITVNGILDVDRLRPLIEDFRRISPGTRLRIRHEVLSGAWESLTENRADLAIAATSEGQPLSITSDRVRAEPMGVVRFVYCMAPHHPLAAETEPIAVERLASVCAVTLADTTRHGEPASVGLLAGQPVITVATMAHKLSLLLAGTGVGFLPTAIAAPHLTQRRLLTRAVALRNPEQQTWYAWLHQHPGQGLSWWLGRLALPIVQRRLLGDEIGPPERQPA